MPTIPSVFRNVRTNDVHQRPFKAFKNYTVRSITDASASKFTIQKASHKKFAAAVGDFTYNYPENAWDGTNQHVVWKSIDHKYYRYPYDQTRCHELTNRNNVEKFIFMTASVFTIPYHEMGERIKPGTVTLSTYVTGSTTNLSNANFDITSSDDGLGNLRDIYVNTGSFASSSRLQMYLTFNNEFRKFEDNRLLGTLKSSDSIKYVLNQADKLAMASNVKIETGVSVDVSGGTVFAPSGLSGYFTGSNSSYIKIKDNPLFANVQRCDNWLLSFWIKPVDLSSSGVILSKHSNTQEQYLDPVDSIKKLREVNKLMPAPGNTIANRRTPLHVSLINDELHFQSSDGSNQLHISASTSYSDGWAHIAIANSASLCQIHVNGTASGTSGKIPIQSTANSANLLIGTDSLLSAGNYFNGNIAEVRLYDYEASQTHISSLANNDFYTGSLYQTNRIGNVFYRNGQIVVSSPMPKYHDMLFTGSAALPNSFQLTYKGQHTIYENEVMVRVPKGTFNVSTNPTSVYRPATGINNDCNTDGGGAETYNRPGDYIKSGFISGTLSPYITTIGLYNDKGEMLAVGKLAEPVQKRDDIDMNFIIRWDY